MDIEFDPAKDLANIDKHGVSLALAADIDWTDVLCMADTRRDYGEVREVGYVLMASRLYSVVFVQRGHTMRIISLRKANSREIEHYEKARETQQDRDHPSHGGRRRADQPGHGGGPGRDGVDR